MLIASNASPYVSESIRDTDFNLIVPSILQCFSIILAGYFSRKFELLNAPEVNGLRIVLVYFLAPTLMTKCLLEVQWQSINWKFLACGFAAKSLVFVSVAFLTLLLTKHFGKAALYAIFATQSNDMALGYPISQALYTATDHADYPRYVYLLMPVSLLALNPIAVFILELDKNKAIQNSGRVRDMILGVIGRVFRNPMVLSTIIGLCGNVLFQHVALPKVFPAVLEGFSSGFIPIALFTLGCTIVTTERTDSQCSIAIALLLTLSKILLLPLILTGLIFVTKIGHSPEDTASLSSFGFLYGSIPTAPTVFVFASLFDLATNQIAVSLALCTFLSAPWLYVSCRMISMKHFDTAQQAGLLKRTSFEASATGFIASVYCLIVFVVLRKCKQLPQKFVFYFIIYSIFINSFSLQSYLVPETATYSQFCNLILSVGQWGCRIFTTVLAISLFMIKRLGIFRLTRYEKLLVLAGFFGPVLLVAGAIFSVSYAWNEPNFFSILFYRTDLISLAVSFIAALCSTSLVIGAYSGNSLRSAHLHVTVDDQSELIGADSTNRIRSNRRCLPRSSSDLSMGDQSATSEHLKRTRLDSVAALPPSTVSDVEAPLLASCQDTDDDDTGGNAPPLPSTFARTTIKRRRRRRPSRNERATATAFAAADCPASASCSFRQRYECKVNLRTYGHCVHTPSGPEDSVLFNVSGRFPFGERDFTAHSIFVALQCVSALLDSVVCFWRLFDSASSSATFLQLKLLNCVLICTPGIVCIWLFGESALIFDVVSSRVRRFLKHN